MKLAEFQTPRENFSIFNFTTVRLGEHKRNSFLISNNCEMASVKNIQPLTHRLNHGGGFLLYCFSKAERVRDITASGRPLLQHSSQRKVGRIRLDFEGYAVLNRAQTSVT